MCHVSRVRTNVGNARSRDVKSPRASLADGTRPAEHENAENNWKTRTHFSAAVRRRARAKQLSRRRLYTSPDSSPSNDFNHVSNVSPQKRDWCIIGSQVVYLPDSHHSKACFTLVINEPPPIPICHGDCRPLLRESPSVGSVCTVLTHQSNDRSLNGARAGYESSSRYITYNRGVPVIPDPPR